MGKELGSSKDKVLIISPVSNVLTKLLIEAYFPSESYICSPYMCIYHIYILQFIELTAKCIVQYINLIMGHSSSMSNIVTDL